MLSSSCVLLLSGGQDSTTCLFWARKKFSSIYAVGFNYGQKHVEELRFASEICADYQIPYHIFSLHNLFTDSSLLAHSQADHNATHTHNPQVPQSFVAGRNALFLSIAATHAYAHRTEHLVCGVCETDYSGYPDCRDVFIRAQEKALSLALDYPLHIHTPLMRLSKAETWRLARELSTPDCDVVDIIRKRTLTDYNGDMTMNEWGRGRLDNPASVLRERGFSEAREKGWI